MEFIAILLPALSKARDAAKAAVCGNTLKQFGLAFVQYANDNNDSLPMTGGFPNNEISYNQTDNWIYQLSQGQTKYLASKSDPWGYNSFRLGNDVWACPCDPRTPNSNGVVNGPSYGINPFLTGYYNAGYGTVSPLKIGQIPEPSKTPILFDNSQNQYRAAPCFIEEDSGHLFDHSHSRGDLMLFVDGHTLWIPSLDRDDLPPPIKYGYTRWNYILSPYFTQEHYYWQ
jgi:hypothetical protein